MRTNTMTASARKIAVEILGRLESGDKTLDYLMEAVDQQTPFPDRRDRAFLQTLVYGVLRWKSRLDGALAQLSKIRLDKIDPHVHNILRVGLFQLYYLDRVPPSAAVNTSVALAKAFAAPWTVRFVNAVLRNAASRPPLPPYRKPPRKAAERLALEAAIPRWLCDRWINRFGLAVATTVCEAVNRIPPVTLRTNTLRTDREALLAALQPYAEMVSACSCAPEGIFLRGLTRAVPDLPAYAQGLFQVQDEAAQLIGHIVAPRPEERVLDACAGLGGKTGHLAQLMDNRGLVTAVDREPAKLSRLCTEMARLGINVVQSLARDLETVSEAAPLSTDGAFDRVLLDAPCSGLGVLRRNPDTKWSAGAKALHRLAAVQERLLTQAAALVKPGGTLAYVVCSTEPEETRSVIRAFLSAAPMFEIWPITDVPAIPAAGITPEGFFTTWPALLDMDGFFCARLKRRRFYK